MKSIKQVSFFGATHAAFTMIGVKGGTFNMGSNEYETEQPIHRVELSDFWVGQFLVTQTVWKKGMNGQHPSSFKGDNLPVECVSWEAIVNEFLPHLNQLTKKTRLDATQFALPTEMQWEYAARGGVQEPKSTFKYSGSNQLKEVGWYDENSRGGTKPVGLLRPNLLNIYDMSGNVSEWCQDFYSPYKDVVLDNNSQGIRNEMDTYTTNLRVLRGGGWDYGEKYCRVSNRSYFMEDEGCPHIGFRLCLNFV